MPPQSVESERINLNQKAEIKLDKKKKKDHMFVFYYSQNQPFFSPAGFSGPFLGV
jgi:hypothetical protein